MGTRMISLEPGSMEARIRIKLNGKEIEICGPMGQYTAEAYCEGLELVVDMELDECNQAKVRQLFHGKPERPDTKLCQTCMGEGSLDSGPHCTKHCDWCGGCYTEHACTTCQGAMALDVQPEDCMERDDFKHCPCSQVDLICCYCGEDQ